MHSKIYELAKQAGLEERVWRSLGKDLPMWQEDPSNPGLEKFAKLIVAKVLDEVAERAYYSGDRAWSDELDRRWVELEFGVGELAELKK